MNKSKSSYQGLIWAASLAIPLVVAVLYFIPKNEGLAANLDFLPKLNAFLNGTTTLILASALIAIKKKKIELHRKLMLSAVSISIVFLLSYVLYHATHESAKYLGSLGWFYYPMLISHIVLAAVIVPLVLVTLVRALNQRFDRHRKIARIALPLWLYVTTTGVLVYLMMAPYYGMQ